jgi:hypothetical protein
MTAIDPRMRDLARDTAAFTGKVHAAAQALGQHERPETPGIAGPHERTAAALGVVAPLYTQATALRDRALALSTEAGLGGRMFWQRPLEDANRGVAELLDPAWLAARSVAQATGVAVQIKPAVSASPAVGSIEGAAAVSRAVAHSGAALPILVAHHAVGERDVRGVVDRLDNVPLTAVELTNRLGAQGVLFTGALTDAPGYEILRDDHPRGWPRGSSWSLVPGAGGEGGFAIDPSRETPGGRHGHSSTSLALHEYGHTVGYALATGGMRDVSFSASWKDGPWSELRSKGSTAYFTDNPDEWFAESFARYSKSPTSSLLLQHTHPVTYRWLREHLGPARFA